MRILIAGLIGAVAMFIWATVAHTLTPLTSIGLQALPDEASAMATMHASLGDKPGLYFFPFMGGGDAKAMAAQQAKLAVSPHGLIVYNPPNGQAGLSPRQLVIEFVLELIESILTAVVIAYAVLVGFAARVGIAAAVGGVAAIATNLSYWNWYGFALDYSLANAFTEFMKFVFAGAAIAAFLAWRARKAA
jgi:Flp pilus assembly protein protease CpaA